MTNNSNQSRVTIKILNQMKNNSEKISMLTAYDFSFAKIIDEAGIDIILVGVAKKTQEKVTKTQETKENSDTK